MAKSCRILMISITLLFLALGMFGFTFGILPSPDISFFRISLWLTRYACLWTGIPMLIQFMIMASCIFTCLCSIVTAIVLGIACEGYCFEFWSSPVVKMYVALIFDAGVVAMLTLSIVACCTACKDHNERVDRPDTIQLVQNPEPDTHEMV